jgi:hypothetical protein
MIGMALAVFALVASGALTLAACGGGGSSKQKPVASAATGASGSAGATGAGKAATGASGGSGGSAAPAGSTPKPARTKQSKPAGGGTSTQPSSGTSTGTKHASKKKTSKKQAAGPPSWYTGQQKELYREAKIVCSALTLDGLAKEYIVKKTPAAVARAYSRTYPVNLRGAVFTGCKAGVS